MDSPFLRPDDRDYAEILTDATIHVLGAQGVDRWSVRAVARWMKVTPAAVLNDYSRRRVLEIVIICFERRWLAWAAAETMYGPSPTDTPLRLPATPDEHLGVRVLSSLQLLAESERLRGNPAPAVHLGRLRKEEQVLLRHRVSLLAERLGTPMPAEEAVTATLALVTGLRLALADPSPAITYPVACELLMHHVARLLEGAGSEGSRIAS